MVEVRIRELPDTPGRPPIIEFRQTVPELDNPLPFKTTLRVAEALKLPATSLHEIMPARIARKGSTRLLLPIADPRALDVLAPNADTLMSLGQELGADGFFVFAIESKARRRTNSRPSHACSALRSASPKIRRAAMRTPCSLPTCSKSASSASRPRDSSGSRAATCAALADRACSLEMDDGALAAAHIGGSAVIVSEGTLWRSRLAL